MPQLLIHGLTNQTDALAAARLGVDGLGFHLNQHDTRYIEYTLARNIRAELPATVQVFVQSDRHDYSYLLEMTTKLKTGALLLPVAAYSESLTTLPCTLTFFGTRAEITDLAARQEHAITAVPTDIYFSDLLMLPADELQPWKWLNQQHHLLIRCDVPPESLPEALEVFHPTGLFFEGGTESHPGLQDYPKIQAYVQTLGRIFTRV